MIPTPKWHILEGHTYCAALQLELEHALLKDFALGWESMPQNPLQVPEVEKPWVRATGSAGV